MKFAKCVFAFFLIAFSFAIFLASVSAGPQQTKPMTAVERGKYLVTVGGCHDCHSPKVFTAHGPEPDMSRQLSGYPGDQKLPELPSGLIAPNKWGAVISNDFTAWYGPWGVSFTANLTPDEETGLGSWTEEMFIKAMRTGKHLGEGRMILPPMPWPNYAQLTDDDLKAIFDYLRSIKPIKNRVPDPIPPAAPPAPSH